MFQRHMLRLHHRIPEVHFAAGVDGNPVSTKEYLHGVGCQPQIYLFSNKIVRNGILVHSIADQIIVTHFQIRRPNGGLIRLAGKRLHEFLFFLQICLPAASGALLEVPVIQFLQLFRNSILRFLHREELSAPQGSEDPGRGKVYAALGVGFVLRVVHSGRNDGGAVIFCQLLISAVQDGFVASVLGNTGLEIVGYQQPSYTAEIIVGMDMAGDPVLQLHIVTDFRIGKAAAGQDSHEQVRLADLTGDRIMDIQSCTGPVHLHSIAGLVLDTHGCLGHIGPTAILFTKIGVHVRHRTFCLALGTVFLPKNGEINTLFSQFSVDICIVGNCIQNGFLILLREQQFYEHLIGNIFRQRPADPGLFCRVQHLSNGMV